MIFSSSVFLAFFLPLLLVLYYLSGRQYRNYVLLFGSIFFYSWGAPKFILVILGTTFLDFILVRAMHNREDPVEKKALLVLSLCMNLGLLFYFKYCNFFIDNINVLFESWGIGKIGALNVILPIGISFYTFETVTYVVDVYRGVHKPLDNFFNYLLYIILFPKLIAGPIIRYHEIADQITDRSANDTLDNRLSGFYRFGIGLAKKVIIANHVAAYADTVFDSDPGQLHAATAWMGALAYTFQIYFDFSGYSDMAIGLGKMLGFRFPENFNNPYISQSITEFWRRWHITLGNWMRNYLYIPLGGNRAGTGRMYLNLYLVFLASGLWHGAAWTFVLWGAWHGLFLILDRVLLDRLLKRTGKITRVLFTFFIVVVGWVMFRADTVAGADSFYKAMLGQNTAVAFVLPEPEYWPAFALAIFFGFFCFFKRGDLFQQKIYFGTPNISGHIALTAISLLLFTLSLSYITAAGFNPFIYFRF
ncbi:MAG: membrane bound O-acyl transferase MBOAT family protein [Bacteroidetes bacterium]|nr:MAG: membrane bound O-acyl transferase MBOAT family protein [Bacteroidota bacterium]